MVIATTPFEFATSIQAAGFLDPEGLLKPFGSLALAVACGILLIECALLIGLVLPGDSLLFIVGILLATGFISTPVWIAITAFLGLQLQGTLYNYYYVIMIPILHYQTLHEHQSLYFL